MDGKIGNEEGITPIVDAVLENVKDWHGIISEYVNEDGFKFSLNEVSNEQYRSQTIGTLRS